MKKTIGASLVLLTLASCGTPKIESPIDALKQNQTAIIENVEKLQKMTPNQAKSVGIISFDIEAKGGKIDSSIKYDFKANQTTYETAGNLAIDFNVETNIEGILPAGDTLSNLEKIEGISPVGDVSGNINLDLITLKDKFLFKLNTLDIKGGEDNFQLGMITGIVSQFQNNWYFIEIPDNAGLTFNQELLTKQKEIVALAKKHSILAHVATNENADYYDYDVALNEDSVVNFLTELETLGQTETDTASTLSETEIADIKATVQNFNKEVKGNIKINKSNLEYFTLTFSHSDGGFTLENTETTLNMIVNDTVEKAEISYKATKSAGKLDGIISAIQNTKELINGSLSIESDGTTTDVAFTVNAKEELTGEEFKMNIHIADTTTAEDVVIEEPTDAADFQEVVAQINMENNKIELPSNDIIDNSSFSYNQIDKTKSIEEIKLKEQIKSIDKIRVSDLKLLSSAIEQSYKDHGNFPSKLNFNERVSSYLPKIPKDPQKGLTLYGCKLGYYYEISGDQQKYKISSCIVSNLNTTANQMSKLELGYNIESEIIDGFYIND